MIFMLVFLVTVIAVGAFMYSQVKPEKLTTKEIGRAFILAGILILVWWLSQQVSARFR